MSVASFFRLDRKYYSNVSNDHDERDLLSSSLLDLTTLVKLNVILVGVMTVKLGIKIN